MNVSNIRSTLAVSQLTSGKNQPPTMTDNAKSGLNALKTVDMRNVSLNEINALIKS